MSRYYLSVAGTGLNAIYDPPQSLYAESAVNKINSLALLPDGWDYGSGGPISDSVRISALEWNQFLNWSGFWSTDAFPGGDGEVVLATSFGPHYVEVIVEPDSSVSVAYDRYGKQVLYDLRLRSEKARSVIKSIVEQIWNASILSTQKNSTPRITGGQGRRLETIKGRYLLLNAIASQTPDQESVSISRVITSSGQELWGIHPYIGNLTQIYFRQEAH